MASRRYLDGTWSIGAAGLGLVLALLDGDGMSLAVPGSFAPTSAGPAVEQPMSGKSVGTVEAQKAYPLLKTGGPGGNWCKLQLPQGAGWILCSAGTISGMPLVGQNGARQQGPVQAFSRPGNVAGEFDYYLLSLSWTPAFCATHPDREQQCGINTHFGFVIHGLWPQYDRGGYPASCPATESPDAALVEQMLPLMPDRNLISHEWRKHGTCSGLSPKDYFAQATAAYKSLRIPDSLKQPKTAVVSTLAEIEQSFISANPGLTPDMMAVQCRDRVSEIRFCFDKALKLRPCGPGVGDNCSGRATFPSTR